MVSLKQKKGEPIPKILKTVNNWKGVSIIGKKEKKKKKLTPPPPENKLPYFLQAAILGL